MEEKETPKPRPFQWSDLSILGIFLIPAGVMLIHVLFDPTF